jgi:hypothetical protein
MPEIKLRGKPLEQRIADRLKNSGEGANPDISVTKGTGPTRTHHNIHHSPQHARPSNAQLDQDGNGGEGR